MRDEQRQLAAALGRVPSGLFILSVRRDKVESGMLASWVQQCSFNPPHLTLAIHPDREIAGLLTKDSLFTLNILDESQTDMIGHFGRGFSLNERPFEGLDVDRSQANGPVLNEALAFLDCQVVECLSAGDHNLFVAKVLAGRMLGEGHPMVHIRKSGMHY